MYGMCLVLGACVIVAQYGLNGNYINTLGSVWLLYMTHSCMNRAVQIGPPPRHHTLDKKAALWAILYIDNINIRAAEGHTYTNNVAGLFSLGP